VKMSFETTNSSQTMSTDSAESVDIVIPSPSSPPSSSSSSPPSSHLLRPPWAWRMFPIALAGGDIPETVCSHLGGAGGGAWQIMQYLDNRWDAARLSLVCQEFRDMTADYKTYKRWRSPGWNWPVGRLQGVVTTVFDGASALPATDVDSIAVNLDDSLLIGDKLKNRIIAVSSEGSVSTLITSAAARDGAGTFRLSGIVGKTDGSVILSDSLYHRLCSVSPTGELTYLTGEVLPAVVNLGNLHLPFSAAGSTDGPASSASFCYPGGLALGAGDSIYIADSNNHTIRLLRDGMVTTVAGTAEESGFADGVGPAARFNYPSGIAATSGGRLFVADTLNHTIRCISAEGVVTTVAGAAGVEGYADGVGADARFNRPAGIVVCADGSLLVADGQNYTIRHISPSGIVSTLAGLAMRGGTANGLGSAARFRCPAGLALGPDGSLYVADVATVRRIT